jgi:hypothetical protein
MTAFDSAHFWTQLSVSDIGPNSTEKLRRHEVLYHCVIVINSCVFLILFWITCKILDQTLLASISPHFINHPAFVALSTGLLMSGLASIFFGTRLTRDYAYETAQTCIVFHKLGKSLFKTHPGYEERPLLTLPLCPMASRFHDDHQLPFPVQFHNLVANSLYSMEKLFLFWDASNVIISIFLFYQFINGQGKFLMGWYTRTVKLLNDCND